MNNLKILDCTLRDGGYYNNWKFDNSQVKKYLESLAKANVDIIEIGFHFLDRNTEYGDYAYIDEKYLKNLKFTKKTKLAVMFNGSDFTKNKNTLKFLNKTFKHSKNFLDTVRIAIHLKDIRKIKDHLNFFKKKILKYA